MDVLGDRGKVWLASITAFRAGMMDVLGDRGPAYKKPLNP